MSVRFATVDYSHNADARGWGQGWPTDRSKDMAVVDLAVHYAGDSEGRNYRAQEGTQSFLVHKRIAPLVQLLLEETQRRGYAIVAGWCWSYENRAIDGTQTPSNHSWGLAIDLDAPLNPYTTPRVTNMPAWLPELWNRYGFAWGGDYTGEQDSMHFEYMGTYASVPKALKAARAELTAAAPAAPAEPQPIQDQVVALYKDQEAFEKAMRAMVRAEVQDRVTAVVREEGISGANNHAKQALAAIGKLPTLADITTTVTGAVGAQLADVKLAVTEGTTATLAGAALLGDELYRRLARGEFNGQVLKDHVGNSFAGVQKLLRSVATTVGVPTTPAPPAAPSNVAVGK